MLLRYVIISLYISASYQQLRSRIISGPNHRIVGKMKGNITFSWAFKLWPERTWIESVEDVAFGIWKPPGYLNTKLIVIGKNGEVMTRPNYGDKISCKFNMSRLQVAFTVRNLTTRDEKQYGLHIELGLPRNPLTDVVTLRLEDPPKIIAPLNRNISLRTGDELVINCKATGLPRPQVTWARYGRVFTSHTLVLRRVNKSDGGMYLCKATSTAGEDRKQIFVRVEDGGNPSQETVSGSGSTLSQNVSDGRRSILLLTGSSGLVALLLLAVIFCYWRRRRLNRGIPYSPQHDAAAPT